MRKLSYFLFFIICYCWGCSNGPEYLKIAGSGGIQPLSTASSSLPHQVDLSNLSAFQNPGNVWQISGDINANMGTETLKWTDGKGILMNMQKSASIFTHLEHGDIELKFEFLLPKGGASGVLLQGRYEIELKDSWGEREITDKSCGAILGQKAPAQNVAKAPGLWQTLRISFRAPLFDSGGNKLRDAIIEGVWLNGIQIHNMVKVSEPTIGAGFQDEKAIGPLAIQGNEGQIAIRNMSYDIYDGKGGGGDRELSEIRYIYYEFSDSRGKVGDLSKLKPAKTGLISDFNVYAIAERDGDYAIRFEADLDIETEGNYVFFINSDDGSLFYVDNKLVVDNDGTHAPAEKRGRIRLTKGKHPIRLDFFQGGGGAFLQVHYRGPDIPKNPINRPISDNTIGAVSLLIEPEENEAFLLRSFVPFRDGKRTHCLSVGTPQGIHYNLDLNQGAWLQAWSGSFVDVSQMWVARGIEQVAISQGSVISFSGKPDVAPLENKQSIWPDTLDGNHFKHLRYDLDEQGLPTVNYELNGQPIIDKIFPSSEGNGLTRALNFGKGRYARIGSGKSIQKLADNSFSVDGEYFLRIDKTNGKIIIREFDDLQEILVADGGLFGGSNVTYSVIW